MMKFQRIASSFELRAKYNNFALLCTRRLATRGVVSQAGFTLLETLVAITLLSVAIVAPMSLTTQSLNSAYYARDQITASFLAQEAIEAVRSVRDANILLNSLGTQIDLLNGVPSTAGQPFRIDARDNSMVLCSADPGGTCKPLQTDGVLYGYSSASGWATTQFQRTVTAVFVTTDEVKVTVIVNWTTGPLQNRSFTISENLYRWINDGSASAT